MLLQEMKKGADVRQAFRLLFLMIVCVCVLLSGCGREIAPSDSNQVSTEEPGDTAATPGEGEAQSGGGEESGDTAETSGEGEAQSGGGEESGDTAETSGEGEAQSGGGEESGGVLETPGEEEAQNGGEESAQTLQEMEERLQTVTERLQTLEKQIQAMAEQSQTETEQSRRSPGIFEILLFIFSAINFLLMVSILRSFKKQKDRPKHSEDAGKLPQDGFSPPPTQQSSRTTTEDGAQAGRGMQAEYNTQMERGVQAEYDSARTEYNTPSPAPAKPEIKYFKVSSARSGTVFLEEDQNSGDVVGYADAGNPEIYRLLPLMQNAKGRSGTISEGMLSMGSLPHCFTVESARDLHTAKRWISVDEPAAAMRQDGKYLKLTRRGRLRVTGNYTERG